MRYCMNCERLHETCRAYMLMQRTKQRSERQLHATGAYKSLNKRSEPSATVLGRCDGGWPAAAAALLRRTRLGCARLGCAHLAYARLGSARLDSGQRPMPPLLERPRLERLRLLRASVTPRSRCPRPARSRPVCEELDVAARSKATAASRQSNGLREEHRRSRESESGAVWLMRRCTLGTPLPGERAAAALGTL